MMIELANRYEEGYISLKEISEKQNISKKYLEQIIPLLNKDNLLTTNRGHMGGYRLSKAPEEITVMEIIESAEGSLKPVSCMEVSPNECTRCTECLTLPIYEGLYTIVNDYLSKITLKDVVDGKVPRP